ncbi:MAG TPA: ribosome biogenesis GTPase Der [Thermoanaerobaculia bacterium]
MSGRLFRVVIAGRPNVGKSTLFNRLVKKRRSLVHDLPGMTRDVVEERVTLPDGRVFRLFDTGGYDPSGRDAIPAAVRRKALEAIGQADLLFLVVDGAAGIAPGDRLAAEAARQSGVETVVVANKVDRKDAEAGELEAWELGFSEVLGVSAEHGIGVDDVLEAVAKRMPAAAGADAQVGGEPDAAEPPEIAIAVVGRPNVGKSSLVNALLGSERSIVSEVAGTTRDAVDAHLELRGRRLRLVDTAGIRRKGRTERGPEVLSVVHARRRIEQCDVAILVLDASEGPTAQDATVASYAHDAGKGLVLVANKWDLATRPGVEGNAISKAIRSETEQQIPFARHAPVILVSAKSGRGVAKVLEAAVRVAANRQRRISTAELNRVLGRPLRDKAPRTASGKTLRVLYVAQTATDPPTFAIVGSREERLHFSEERRIENLLREAADFSGSPIRIEVRQRSGADREAEKKRGSRPRPGFPKARRSR